MSHTPVSTYSMRRLDCLAPRPRPPGEGEGVAAFWEAVRTFHGRVSRIDFERSLLALVKAGRLADAWLLAVQFDREEDLAETPPIVFPGVCYPPGVAIDWGLPIKGWEQAWRQWMRETGQPLPKPYWEQDRGEPEPRAEEEYRHPDHRDADQIEHHPPPAEPGSQSAAWREE